MSGSNLLFIFTGSIAGYKACEAVSRLVQRGHRLRVVMTEAARHFVGPATLEGLTSERVLTELFEPGTALEHIALVRWADAVMVCPATADFINRVAAGRGDDLAATLLLAHDWKKPLLIAPAMNPAMWSHPATRASVEKLTEWGARFISGDSGRTACGEVGDGRLAEPDVVIAQIEQALARPARRLRVLVTGGGTAEPVDGVRVLTNTSTGVTAALIAEHFAERGHDVTLLRGVNARGANAGVRELTFTDFASLDAALNRLLGAEAFDALIHAAAVSDYSVEAVIVDGVPQAPGAGKLTSARTPLLQLRLNAKLVDTLRARSRQQTLKVVAFKLTAGANESEARAAVAALQARSGADFVVHNDLKQKQHDGPFPAELWRADGTSLRCVDRESLAATLENELMRVD